MAFFLIQSKPNPVAQVVGLFDERAGVGLAEFREPISEGVPNIAVVQSSIVPLSISDLNKVIYETGFSAARARSPTETVRGRRA